VSLKREYLSVAGLRDVMANGLCNRALEAAIVFETCLGHSICCAVKATKSLPSTEAISVGPSFVQARSSDTMKIASMK
jgi:hypothetical protein